MRNYIFTRYEEEQLLRWLEEDQEEASTTALLSRIRNADRLLVHVELMSLCLRKLEREGRIAGRMRLPSDLATRASLLSGR